MRRLPAALMLLALVSPAAISALAAEDASHAAFHRGFFLQTHEGDFAAAAQAYDEAASNEQLKTEAARRASQCREELALFAMPSGAAGRAQGPAIPDVGLVMAVKDAAKSEILWDQLLSLPAMLGIREFPARHAVTVEGVQGKAYAMPEGPTIVVARLGARAMVAGTEPAVAAAIRSETAGGGIERDAVFKPLIEQLAPTTSKAVLLNMGRVVQVAGPGMPRQSADEFTIAAAALKDMKISAVTDEGPNQFTVRVNVTGLPQVMEIAKMVVSAQQNHLASERASVQQVLRRDREPSEKAVRQRRQSRNVDRERPATAEETNDRQSASIER